jgi:hypothetical protein
MVDLRRIAVAALLICGVSGTLVPLPVAADPPPWAPAHGYRKKHGKDEVVVVAPRRECGRFDNQAIGSAAGGGTGGLLGSMVSRDRDERLIGGAVGAAGGALLGGVIGQSADRDRGCR